jgi:4-amino-4-deoxy-L-arabinose transferase-like glycosyltransferase
MERPVRAAFVGALSAACITLPGLGVGTLWDNSETAYGEVAREILLTHDWIVMHLNGAPWFIQPPLYFWVAAIFAMIFGPTPFALRLPAAIATILMGGLTGYAVARQAGTRVGIYAAVILSTSLIQAIIGRLAIMDALLDLMVALAIFWWFRALETGRSSYFIYGWCATALGFLVKGPVAPVIALLVIVPYAWWNRRAEPTRLPSARTWIVALIAAAAIATPWLAAIAAHSGVKALVELIGHYTFGRYTGVIENQAGPVWYYVPVVILGFFPWIAFLPMAIVYGMQQLRSPGIDPGIARLWRLAFVWMIVPFVFFSFAKTKLPNYIALEFPALALATALYFDAIVRKGVSRSAMISAISVPAFIGMLAFAIWAFSRDNRLGASAQEFVPVLTSMGIAIFVGSVVTAVMLSRRATVRIAPYALAIAALIAVDTLCVGALPRAERYKPVPHLAAVIQAQRQPGDVVAIQSFRGGNALVFYTMPPVYAISPPGAPADDEGVDPKSVICTHDRVWLVAPKKRPEFDPTYGRNRKEVATSGSGALFLIDGAPCHGD